MPHQMPQQAPMPQLQVPMPPMLPMPQLPGQHVPGIPLRGTLSMALPGVEEMAVIADDDMNRRAASLPPRITPFSTTPHSRLTTLLTHPYDPPFTPFTTPCTPSPPLQGASVLRTLRWSAR